LFLFLCCCCCCCCSCWTAQKKQRSRWPCRPKNVYIYLTHLKMAM
jgi:hypothetical protein